MSVLLRRLLLTVKSPSCWCELDGCPWIAHGSLFSIRMCQTHLVCGLPPSSLSRLTSRWPQSSHVPFTVSLQLPVDYVHGRRAHIRRTASTGHDLLHTSLSFCKYTFMCCLMCFAVHVKHKQVQSNKLDWRWDGSTSLRHSCWREPELRRL